MAGNHVQEGKVLTYANETQDTIAAGSPVIVGDKVGVALVNIAPGAAGSVAVDEVFSLAKAAEAIAIGKKCYLIASNATITGTAGSNVYAGFAHAAAASGDATVDVNLNR